MSDTQNSVWTYPPSAEERAQLAEHQQHIDDARASNARVPAVGPSDRFAGDITQGAPQRQVVRSTDAENVSIPAPASPTFYTRHSSTPRSGTEVGPDDIVEINVPGMGRTKTSVANALNMGLITRDAAGGYRGLDASERNDKATAEQQEQLQERAEASAELESLRLSGDAADAATSGLIDVVVKSVPAPAVQQIVSDLVMNDGTISETAAVRAGELAGWSPDQARQVVERLHGGLSRQAAAAVVSQGVPASEVDAAFAWMQQIDPLAHKHASLSLILNSDATELKRLAKAYYRARVIRQDD